MSEEVFAGESDRHYWAFMQSADWQQSLFHSAEVKRALTFHTQFRTLPIQHFNRILMQTLDWDQQQEDWPVAIEILINYAENLLEHHKPQWQEEEMRKREIQKIRYDNRQKVGSLFTNPFETPASNAAACDSPAPFPPLISSVHQSTQ